MSSIEKAISKLGKTKNSSTDNASYETAQSIDPEAMDKRFNIDNSASLRQIELDDTKMEAAGILATDSSNQLTEELRVIKQPLLNNVFGKQNELIEHGNLIMVTSALPNEGKTFTAINLALSIASELDRTVLLVDSDVQRSGVAEALGFSPEQGLSDLIADENLRLQDVLIKTNVPNLSILSSGSMLGNITELIASDYMGVVISELSNRYPDRIIIFDSPPLLVTSSARALATMMGQILIVVESEVTPQSVVEDAVNLLDSNKVIGFVLNKSKRPIASSYGYGYGYGYGYSQNDDSRGNR